MYAPTPISTLCRKCWNALPEERPSFSNIVDYLTNNFKIKTGVTENGAKEPNSCTLTYAILHFHESNIKNQFKEIEKYLSQPESNLKVVEKEYPLQKIKSSTKGNTVKNWDDAGQSTQPKVKDNSSSTTTLYTRIDPCASRALMNCRLQLELESMLERRNIENGRFKVLRIIRTNLIYRMK